MDKNKIKNIVREVLSEVKINNPTIDWKKVWSFYSSLHDEDYNKFDKAREILKRDFGWLKNDKISNVDDFIKSLPKDKLIEFYRKIEKL